MAMATTVPVSTVLPRKTLVLIGGNPGIGKSDVAKALAKDTALPLLDKDTLLAPFIERADSSAASADLDGAGYESLLNLAGEVAVYGMGCIAVAPFAEHFTNGSADSGTNDSGTNEMLDAVRRRAIKNNCRLITVWLSLDDAQEHESRMRRGGKDLVYSSFGDFSTWLSTQPTAADVSANADVIIDIGHKTPAETAKLIAPHLR